MLNSVSQTFLSTMIKFNWLELFSYFILSAGFYGLLIATKRIILKNIAAESSTKNSMLQFFSQLLDSFNWPFYLSLSLVLAHQLIPLPVKANKASNYIFSTIFTYYLVQTVNQLIKLALDRYSQQQEKAGEEFDAAVISLIKQVLQVLVWAIAGALLLQNFGLQVAALLGGLGVAGIAVAFAVKDILGDVISYFTIFFDKPFRPGDYIVIGEDSGTVTSIGLKSTTLKTLRGEKLIISNKELTQTKIRNFSGMDKRRDTIQLSIDQNTSVDKLKKVSNLIKQVIKQQERVEFDRAYFKEITDTGYLFTATYYVKSGKYKIFADVKKKINLNIVEVMKANEITISFWPEQTIVSKVKSGLEKQK